MQLIKLSSAIALSVAFAGVQANPSPSPANNNNNNANANAGGSTGSTGTTLTADAIQSGSFVDGSKEIGAAEVGQALSATSKNNFINNCSGKTLTNGLQITTGSCNGIPMGDIPAKTAMVSSVITNPQTGGKAIQSDKTFNITVQMANIVAGSFTNADATYYAAPQALQGGKVVGHTHVTVQDMGSSMNPTQPLDATKFAFFKGINDAGDGNGLLSAEVTGGLPAGNYRVCTMASASNHQPVLMPVAQRGTADDCTKFVVSGNGNTENDAANDGAKGEAAAAAAASAVANGAGNDDPNLGKTAAASSTAKANGKGNAAAATTTAAKATATNKNAGNNANAQGQKANAQGQNANAQGQNANAQGQTANKGQGAQAGQGATGGRNNRRMRFARRQFIS